MSLQHLVLHRWDNSTIAVVTGANKGIGYEIAKQLGRHGLHVVVTSRDESRGQKAMKELQQAEPSANFTYCQADITDKASALKCAQTLKEQFGKVHVLINNAGMAYKGNVFGADEAQATIACNLTGTRVMTEAVLPLMHEGARIVNVCSECVLPLFTSCQSFITWEKKSPAIV
jgi:carbonyl reductase 1